MLRNRNSAKSFEIRRDFGCPETKGLQLYVFGKDGQPAYMKQGAATQEDITLKQLLGDQSTGNSAASGVDKVMDLCDKLARMFRYTLSYKVPQLIFQPFIENCFRHAFKKAARPWNPPIDIANFRA